MRYYTVVQTNSETSVEEQLAWAVRLDLETSDPIIYPAKALVFQAETPGDPDTRGWFTCVASPAQLLEYPTDAPSATEEGEFQVPFYRLSTVTLISRNPSALVRLVAQIEEELTLLEDNLEALETLVITP